MLKALLCMCMWILDGCSTHTLVLERITTEAQKHEKKSEQDISKKKKKYPLRSLVWAIMPVDSDNLETEMKEGNKPTTTS